MCGGIPDQESDQELTTRRPTGTRRRQLEWLTNFVLVVVSLFGISVGSGLLAFYRIQLLSFISIEFYIVPLVLLGEDFNNTFDFQPRWHHVLTLQEVALLRFWYPWSDCWPLQNDRPVC